MMKKDTKAQILSAAKAFAQSKGFNAFSYADIAAEVGIRKASIHHHFPTKSDLELELVRLYHQDFLDLMQDIEKKHSNALDRLRAYAETYLSTLINGNICLCGMMASDINALPETLKLPLNNFFTAHSQWLAQTLKIGRESGELEFIGEPEQRGQTLLATLQGGLIIARTSDDTNLFQSLLDDLIKGISA